METAMKIRGWILGEGQRAFVGVEVKDSVCRQCGVGLRERHPRGVSVPGAALRSRTDQVA